MWVTLVLFAALVLAALAGATGRGVPDSRDAAYSLREPVSVPCRRILVVA